MCRVAVCVVLALLAFVPGPEISAAAADEPSAGDLMARVDANIHPDDEVSEASVLLIHANGQQKRWRVKQYYQRAPENGMGAMLLRFLEPVELKGTTLISVNQPDGGNEQWMYLPAFRNPKYLETLGRREFVFGSDLMFEDYVPLVVGDYTYEKVRDEVLEERPAVVVKVVPATDNVRRRVFYHHRLVWIDADRRLILRADDFNDRGENIRTTTWKDYYMSDGKHWRARRQLMFSPLRPHWTEINVSSTRINRGLPPDFFTEQNIAGIR